MRNFFLLLFFSLPGYQALYGQVAAPFSVFLNQPVPVHGAEVRFDPPVLRWPYQKGEEGTYELRLSQDSLFQGNSTLYARELAGAMYNPHRKLSEGDWFWQYRVTGKTWSRLLKFTVPANAQPLSSPRSEEFLTGIPRQHPRILKSIPEEDLRIFSNRPEAIAIVSEAKKALHGDLLSEPRTREADSEGLTELQTSRIEKDAIVRKGHQIHDGVLTLCQAFLLTSENRYRQRAIQIAMAVSDWDPEGSSAQADFTDGACMFVMALVFDTFYQDLNAQQRAKLLTAAGLRTERFYRQWVNNIESKVLSGHVWQLLLNEFFKTGLALHGHDPRADQWLTYAYELFLGRTPVLGGPDGGWAEGASYFMMNMDMLVDIPMKLKSYTGFDFISAHPWYRNQADWLIYQVPPGSSADGFGDNTEELFQPPASYAAYAKVMANLLGDPRFAWYYQKMEALQKIDLAKEPVLRWHRLIIPEMKEIQTDTLTFGMGKLFREAGIASLHTHPSDPRKDIAVSVRASPFGAYGHAHADQNTFNVTMGGERLFFRTGYKVAMNDPHRLGWSMHTKGHNGVLINGEGQPYSIDAGGCFRRFLQGEKLAYLLGDASEAYRSKQRKFDAGLTKFYRHVVLLKPGILVIYDELESETPVTWTWLIHSLENMSFDSTAGEFKATVDSGIGLGRLWSSTSVDWTLKDKFDVPAVSYRKNKGRRYDDTQWHLNASGTVKTSGMRFLSVIRIAREEESIMPLKEENSADGRVSVQVGE